MLDEKSRVYSVSSYINICITAICTFYLQTKIIDMNVFKLSNFQIRLAYAYLHGYSFHLNLRLLCSIHYFHTEMYFQDCHTCT